MKKAILAACLLLGAALPAAGQITSVSATITDPGGIPYAQATVKAQLVLAGAGVTGQPTVQVNSAQLCRNSGFGSAPCQVPFIGTVGPITLDANGSFTMNLQDNTLVTPAATQWQFSVTISPGVPLPLGFGPQSFTVTTSVSGATLNLSTILSAAAPRLARSTIGTPPITVGPPVGACTNGSLSVDSNTGVIYSCVGGTWISVTVTSGVGAPVGSCQPNQLYVDTTTGTLYTCQGGTWHSTAGGGTGTVTSFSYSETGLDALMSSNVTNPSTTPNLAQTAQPVPPATFLAGPIPTGTGTNPTFELSAVNNATSGSPTVTATPAAVTSVAIYIQNNSLANHAAPDGVGWNVINNTVLNGSVYYKNLSSTAPFTASSSTVPSSIWNAGLMFFGGSISAVAHSTIVPTGCGIGCQSFTLTVTANNLVLVVGNWGSATQDYSDASVTDTCGNSYAFVAHSFSTTGASGLGFDAFIAQFATAGSCTITMKTSPSHGLNWGGGGAFDLTGPTSFYTGPNGPWAFRQITSQDLAASVGGLGFSKIQVATASGCTPPSANTYDACEQSISWPVPFVDTSYLATPSCVDSAANGGNSATNDSLTLYIKAGQTASAVTVITQNNRSIANHCTTVQVIGVHP